MIEGTCSVNLINSLVLNPCVGFLLLTSCKFAFQIKSERYNKTAFDSQF
jgi:hypothetical protein